VTVPLFFADPTQLRAAVAGEPFELAGSEGHHASTVRRLSAGERLDLSDGAGLVFSAEVTGVRGRVLLTRLIERAELARPLPSVTVVQALAKGDRDERAVETMTEVGVDAIVAWQAARSIVRWDSGRADKGIGRWRSTAREAAKQARRPWLVDVPPLESTAVVVSRLEALRARGGLAIVLHEAAERPLAGLNVGSPELLLVVGPEGGVDDDERAGFEAAGAVTCRLGPTVLRTSTAGPIAAAIVMASSGRWL
jgi:16S rRNA (uracil1498-N3)-methyltransferase